jgi:predicted acylesterase/phospholipase RssA
MNRIGLALSGGGFRATLYHLGLVRFLRDAGLLSEVTHITSVSGGSIFAAHLALNWDRYNSSANEFDAAASEILSLVRLDVRNRIVRRFPLTIPLRWPRRLLGFSNRKLTRTGLLEYHYEKYLYGDTSLFELPQKPQLHILATNLSEGCLCSFTRDGLLMVRRQSGQAFRIDRIPVGLATVPMAVTASSAFPSFFPPIELTGADVGATSGGFGRQAYTDGGVFDNLGVRMFRCLERSILADTPLSPDDFFDLPAVFRALREASESTEETPLRRLSQVLVEAAKSAGQTPLRRLAQAVEEVSSGEPAANEPAIGPTSSKLPPPSSTTNEEGPEELALSSLREVMSHYQFYHEPLFARLKPTDPEAEELLHTTRQDGRILNATEQIFLNRHLLEAAYHETTGHSCFRRLNSGLDGVIVSDVGKPIQVKGDTHAGGLIRTALRSSDILMNRVWQLEEETFRKTPGYVFAPITEVVEPREDPTAMHPEVQRQTATIRTDLDRFSFLEISRLVRHGYCVGRKACRARPDLFGTNLPLDIPWDPIPLPREVTPVLATSKLAELKSREPAEVTVEARKLQASALRHIWSSFFDRRDWTSYLYLPLLAALIFLPIKAFKYYQNTKQAQLLIEWLYQGNKDMEQIQEILDVQPSAWPKGSSVVPEERDSFKGLDNKGFRVLKETQIADLRLYNPTDPNNSMVQDFRRDAIVKQTVNPSSQDLFLMQLTPDHDNAQVRFPLQTMHATLVKTPDKPDPLRPGARECLWGALYDFGNTPDGQIELLSALSQSPGLHIGSEMTGNHMRFNITNDTSEFTMWILMPSGQTYSSWTMTRRPIDSPESPEVVRPVEEYRASDYTIIGFELLSVPAGYTYEVGWTYGQPPN